MIALGTPVTYHHRAAVARWTPEKSDFSWKKGWTLYEGVRKGAYDWTTHVCEEERFSRWTEIKHHWGLRTLQTINKTVMVWPEDGSGVVIGRVKRARGVSHRAMGGGEDWEPGYFDATDYFKLYCVRGHLDDTGYALVPEWALTPIHGGTA